ncbi:MAG: peptidase caspase catalytic subunit p20, partial [Planctomycetaceae bacterium]|nr:peptidase caspase catalytic subunit p20 [Planctomycetaceae bacterium]
MSLSTSGFCRCLVLGRQRLAMAMFVVGLAHSLSTVQLSADVMPKDVVESTPAGALAFSPDSKLLAIGAEYKGSLKLWVVGEKAEPRIVDDVKAMYNTVAFSPDGKLLTASSVSLDPAESVVKVWELSGNKRLMEYKFGAFWSAFTPDSKRVAIGKFTMVEFLDARTGKRLSGFKVQNNANVTAAEFAANGKLFVTSGGDEKQLKLWDVKSGKLQRAIAINGVARTVAVSADARYIAYAVEKELFLYDVEAGKSKWSSAAHRNTIMKVCFSPDGMEVATASHDRTARRWKTADGAIISTYEPDRGVVQTATYSPDQKLFAIGTSAVVLIYSLREGGLVQSPSKPTTSARTDIQGSESLSFKTRPTDWKTGEQRKSVLPEKKGIAFISGMAGNLGGPQDSFELQVGKDGVWTLGGTSGDFLAARATSVADLTPVQFSPEIMRFEWSSGKAGVKMLHRKDGICLLSGVKGAFRGYGEEVKIRLADDGYWYLDGKSSQGEIRATALGIKWSK